MRDELERHVYCPPLVRLTGADAAGYLLAWLQHERDGSWQAIVTWIRRDGDRHQRKVMDVRAASVQPLEPPVAYQSVPRLTLGIDGAVRPWEPPPTNDP